MPEHQNIKQSGGTQSSSQKQIIPARQIHVSSPAAIIQRARIDPKSLTSTDILQLQRTIGNRAVGRLLSDIRSSSKVQHESVQRQKLDEEKTCPSCGQRQEIPEEEESLQMEWENNTGMPDNLKNGMEYLSGIDMSDVKVHYNSSKPAHLGALAYTQGTDIHVAPGQERHLPHEAWHVVQQKQGRVRPTVQLKGMMVNDEVELEREADVMGEVGSAKYFGQIFSGYRPTYVAKKNESDIILASQVIGKTGCNEVVQCTRAEIDALKSQENLNEFYILNGGTSQNTLALIRTTGDTHYAIEQQTTTRVREECERIGITYICQERFGGFHAEMRFLSYAVANDIDVTNAEIWVSKDICGDCVDELEERNFLLRTPFRRDVKYYGWRSPTTLAAVPRPRGVFRGHRTEEERLRDWKANT
ncbi:eCIS core domain-containing protein [Methanosarcina sp. T3]|uniref:eCIS core domain-containing protein n=1 Tax=Methanosarcina sp. T3 TaxID=3439062 RepID=UPI003F82B0AB